jgi:hypothetical protein
LELLADFVAHVSVLRVEFSQTHITRVDVLKGEFLLAQGPDDLQDVESPPALLDLQFFEWAHSLVGAANTGRRAWNTVLDHRNARVLRNSRKKNVAPDPPSPAGRKCERLSAFKGRKSKGKSRNENDCAHGPCAKVVPQYEEIWGKVFEYPFFHHGIGRVENF